MKRAEKKPKSELPADSTDRPTPPPAPAALREARLPVTERTLQKAAKRLIDTPLVSVEISYLQRTLGSSETERTIDEAVTGVRKLPWATLTVGS